MFRRYIRHRQYDGYESLQLIKRACYNVQYTLHCVGKHTLHKFKVTKINRCTCTHQQRKRQIDVFDLLNKVRLFPLNVHRLLKPNLIPCRGRV